MNWLCICVKAAVILVLRRGYAAEFMMRRGSHFLRSVLLEGLAVSVISLVWLRVVLVVSRILLLLHDVQVIAEMLERLLIAWLFNICFRLLVSDWLLIGVLNSSGVLSCWLVGVLDGSVLSCWLIRMLDGSVLSCRLVGVLDGSVLSWVIVSTLNICQFSWDVIGGVLSGSDFSRVVKSALDICQFSWKVIFVLSGGSEISWLLG